MNVHIESLKIDIVYLIFTNRLVGKPIRSGEKQKLENVDIFEILMTTFSVAKIFSLNLKLKNLLKNQSPKGPLEFP